MSSIANKDEALNCLSLATKHLRNGDTEKALKFLYKSQKLYKTDEVDRLIQKLTTQQQNGSNTSSNNDNHNTSSSSYTSYTHTHTSTSTSNSNATTNSTTSTASSTTTTDSSNGATSEDIQIITQIKNSKNHYETLGLSDKSCDEKKIKIAYRKLAIKVHPDKNKAPGSEEAFKMISHAYSVLSDDKKRRIYDTTGDDGTASTQTQNRSYNPTRTAFYTNMNDDISAEDIFNMFFGGGGINMNGFARQQQYTYRRRNTQQQQHHNPFFSQHFTSQSDSTTGQDYLSQFNLTSLIHFLPILLLILFSFFSMQSHDSEPYSIHRTSSHNVQRTTQLHHTPYYVDRSFATRYTRDPRALNQVDQLVEQSWLKYYDQQCNNERVQHNENIKHLAASNADRYNELLKQVNDMKFEGCAKLAEQYSKL